ncbi:MAG: hypothetical protein Kow002_03560 [Anaerolineales bacterium]
MKTLLFVYNADSGLLNGLKDWAHKIVSPGTYPCSLCALTYDNLGMIRSWRKFVDGLGMQVEFLHRDELAETYGIQDVPLPAVFLQVGGEPELWLEAESMNACQTLEELQQLIQTKVS